MHTPILLFLFAIALVKSEFSDYDFDIENHEYVKCMKDVDSSISFQKGFNPAAIKFLQIPIAKWDSICINLINILQCSEKFKTTILHDFRYFTSFNNYLIYMCQESTTGITSIAKQGLEKCFKIKEFESKLQMCLVEPTRDQQTCPFFQNQHDCFKNIINEYNCMDRSASENIYKYLFMQKVHRDVYPTCYLTNEITGANIPYQCDLQSISENFDDLNYVEHVVFNAESAEKIENYCKKFATVRNKLDNLGCFDESKVNQFNYNGRLDATIAVCQELEKVLAAKQIIHVCSNRGNFPEAYDNCFNLALQEPITSESYCKQTQNQKKCLSDAFSKNNCEYSNLFKVFFDKLAKPKLNMFNPSCQL